MTDWLELGEVLALLSLAWYASAWRSEHAHRLRRAEERLEALESLEQERTNGEES